LIAAFVSQTVESGIANLHLTGWLVVDGISTLAEVNAENIDTDLLTVNDHTDMDTLTVVGIQATDAQVDNLIVENDIEFGNTGTTTLTKGAGSGNTVSLPTGSGPLALASALYVAPTYPSALYRRTTNFGSPSASEVEVSWNSAIYDDIGITGLGPLTDIPPGSYNIDVGMIYRRDSNTTGVVEMAIGTNDGTDTYNYMIHRMTKSDQNYQGFTGSVFLLVPNGDVGIVTLNSYVTGVSTTYLASGASGTYSGITLSCWLRLTKIE
jgi:hypothetical protein